MGVSADTCLVSTDTTQMSADLSGGQHMSQRVDAARWVGGWVGGWLGGWVDGRTEWVGGWVGGWMDGVGGWVGGWTEWVGGWVDGRSGWVGGWMDGVGGWVGGWVDGRTEWVGGWVGGLDGWMDGWMRWLIHGGMGGARVGGWMIGWVRGGVDRWYRPYLVVNLVPFIHATNAVSASLPRRGWLGMRVRRICFAKDSNARMCFCSAPPFSKWLPSSRKFMRRYTTGGVKKNPTSLWHMDGRQSCITKH